MPVVIPRSPWPPDFPDVVVHNNLRTRNSHLSYPAAKSGDPQAARILVEDLLGKSAIERLRTLLADRRPVLLPVTAEEAAGFNAIPDAMAQAIAASLGLAASAGAVVQANKVAHTRADGWHRLVTPPLFVGEITAGTDYLLVDDHVGFGGTVANLRGFVEQQGGHVLGMTTLTETRDGRHIAIRKETLDVLQETHGTELEHFWKEEFGYGFDCLTNIEAGYLCRAGTVATIKNRMAQAAELARSGGLSTIQTRLKSPGEPEPPDRSR